MKDLFMAAIKSSRHIYLSIFVVCFLFLLTIADQMERFSLGIITNIGVDFFVLFSEDKNDDAIILNDQISLDQISEKWNEIDKDKKGYISKQDATMYMSAKKMKNPLLSLFYKLGIRINKNIYALISILLVIAFFKAFILFISRFITQLLSIRITKDLRFKYFEHIQKLPFSFYQKYDLGSLTSRAVGDASQIAASLNSCIVNYFHTPFTIITTFYFCVYLSWQLSLIILIGLPSIIFPIIFFTKKVKKIAKQMQKNQESFFSILLDFLSGVQIVKIFSIENFILKKFEKQNVIMANLEIKNAKYSLLTRPILHAITTICLACVLIVGLYVLHMSLSQIIVFCGLLHLFYEPIKKFAEETANIQKGIVAAERMFEVFKINPKEDVNSDLIELNQFNHKIEFENVSFKYNNTDDWVLKNLSFSVEKGQSVAIMGATGAGKSTIVNLIVKLFEVQEGDIKIDGISIKKFNKKSLSKLISFVPQKPFLFFDTIYENILFGRPSNKKEVVDACRSAYAHEFITQLEDEYDAIISSVNSKLSGGQQQRLTIARALLKSTPILILDEATASLDPISENKIKLAILESKKRLNQTQIFIAHKPAMIDCTDKIIYIDKGEKIAEGSKQDLLKTSPHFRQVWEHFKLFADN